MKKISYPFIFLLISLSLVTGVWASEISRTDADLAIPAIKPSGGPLGSRIDIAISTNNEAYPAVSYCGGYYLVVYVMSGAIYGQRLDPEGVVTGDPILIYEGGDFYPFNPAVACLWPSFIKQYFIVVWEQSDGINSDYDIYVQALTPSGDLFVSALPIANSSVDEMHPAIACEVDDYTCLVVFEKELEGDMNVLGRRMIMTNFGLDLPVAEFYTGSDADHDYYPAVTWSNSREEYLVVWQDLLPSSTPHDRIRFSTIYEDEHGVGYYDEWKGGSTYLNSASSTGENDQLYPDVDFNLISNRYMVTYLEDRPASYAAVGVYLWEGMSSFISSFPMDIETNLGDNIPPAVAYSGGPVGIINTEDEFLAVNAEIRESHYQMQGAYFWKNWLMATDVPIETLTNDDVIRHLDITGNPYNGRYLVVWEQGSLTNDYNIYGRMIDNGGFEASYLPLLMR